MFRKITLALVATAALGTAALAPTSASAWSGGWHGHHNHHRHWGPRYNVGFYGPAYAAYDGCYMKKRWVQTPFGARLRWVKVCY